MEKDILNTWQLANELEKKYKCGIQTHDLKNIINFAKKNKHCGLIEQKQGEDCDYLFKKELIEAINIELINYLRILQKNNETKSSYPQQ